MHGRGSLLHEARTIPYMGAVDICCVETGGVAGARTMRVVPYLESFAPYLELIFIGTHMQPHVLACELYYIWKPKVLGCNSR